MEATETIQHTGAGIFEGYTGIRLGEGQVMSDVLFASIFFLFVCFSIIYRKDFRLFIKMVQDLYSVKERQSLFLLTSNNETFFRSYMIFQMLALSSLAIFSIARIKGVINQDITDWEALLALGILFIVLSIYYLIKKFFYFSICHVFFDRSTYKLWKTNYYAVMGPFGVLLYIPVLWLVFVGSYPDIPIWMFIIFFILSRLVIIYKLIRIFHSKGNDILYLILYLCTQEILPLVFLYKSLVYLYNVIETSTLWH